MKFFYTQDEWYPVVQLEASSTPFFDTPAIEFTDEEVADIKRVEAEFQAWQLKIAERFGITDHDARRYVLIENLVSSSVGRAPDC